MANYIFIYHIIFYYRMIFSLFSFCERSLAYPEIIYFMILRKLTFVCAQRANIFSILFLQAIYAKSAYLNLLFNTAIINVLKETRCIFLVAIIIVRIETTYTCCIWILIICGVRNDAQLFSMTYHRFSCATFQVFWFDTF